MDSTIPEHITHAREFTFTDYHYGIREIDSERLWVVVRNEEGHEVELVIKGLTYGTLADYIRENPPED